MVSFTATRLANTAILGAIKGEILNGFDAASDTILAGNRDDFVFGKRVATSSSGRTGSTSCLAARAETSWTAGGPTPSSTGAGGNPHGGLAADTFETGSTASTGVERVTDFKLGTDDILLGTGITVVSYSMSELDDNGQLDPEPQQGSLSGRARRAWRVRWVRSRS